MTANPIPLETLRLRSDRRLVTLTLVLLLVPALWFLRTDVSLFSGDLPRLWGRFAVRATMAGAMTAGIALMSAVRTRAAYGHAVFASAMAIALTGILLNLLRPPGDILPIRAPLLLLTALYFGMPNTLRRHLVPPLVLSAGLIVLRLTRLTSTAGGDIPGDILVMLILNVVGILATRRRAALEGDLAGAWEAEHTARLASEHTLAELAVLRGIIPICSHCRKVRTEAGQWQQIEQYVRDHSDAEFSHGICPSCERRHFGVT